MKNSSAVEEAETRPADELAGNPVKDELELELDDLEDEALDGDPAPAAKKAPAKKAAKKKAAKR